MTNALVEMSLILVTVALGVLGSPIWVVAFMVLVSCAWWGFVHHQRFGVIVKAGIAGAIGSLVLAVLLIGVGHLIGYSLGGAFRAIIGMT